MQFLWWCRIRGSILPSIWWKVLFLLLYSTVVVSIETYVKGLYTKFPIHLIVILGTVIGFLLVFRTHTAYIRFWEGRQVWARMTQEIRRMTRAIWSGVKESETKDVIEKKSALNLCIAFVVAMKHYLREEYSYDYSDYEGLLDHLPRFCTPSSNMSMKHQQSLQGFDFKGSVVDIKALEHSTPTNIPMEVSYSMVSYVKYLEENELANPVVIATLQKSIAKLVDCIAGFECLMRTPMPLAYSIHLQVCVWLFLLSIPYQTIGDSGPIFTVVMVVIASFCYLGILEIGFHIENPFGYDENDLPLDDFCVVIAMEIQRLLVADIPGAPSWLYSTENKPFGQACSLTATELAELSIDEAKDILQVASRTALVSSKVASDRRRAESKLDLAASRTSLNGYQQI